MKVNEMNFLIFKSNSSKWFRIVQNLLRSSKVLNKILSRGKK